MAMYWILTIVNNVPRLFCKSPMPEQRVHNEVRNNRYAPYLPVCLNLKYRKTAKTELIIPDAINISE